MPEVHLTRTGFATYEATNERGATIRLGQGDDVFSPVELLLTAIAGCSAIDIDYITSRRAEPVTFDVTSSGVRDADDNHRLTDLTVTFRIAFPEGADGDQARKRLPQAVRQSHEQLCTVSRTVEHGVPVEMRLAE